ncbi:hypothetical protein BSF41_16900 [Flavobacterium sp. ACN2]|jgi:hypothetical protein|uniref:hypothetical protein n=1 Tax=Flavobacterium sp. ACN2 TaxID=1975676 RepID=UPI000BB3BA7B|nr:hypothetical protein [Flavobacterium sp. ACN2]PBI90984.1 hypothetical protein BSF41_16900 [Flavobacterium sp. ACN2]
MKITITALIMSLISYILNTNEINHYLPQKITSNELLENGFYKYSFTEEVNNDEDEYRKIPRVFKKYEVYSNIKPEIYKGKFRPMNVPSFINQDTVSTKKRQDYLRNELMNRTLMYVFRNDTLLYKNITVIRPQSENNIADFTTSENIKRYYNDLKISIKPIIDKNQFSTVEHPTIYLINNYRTEIRYNYYGYDMITNYSKEKMPESNTVYQWYRRSEFVGNKKKGKDN